MRSAIAVTLILYGIATLIGTARGFRLVRAISESRPMLPLAIASAAMVWCLMAALWILCESY